MKLLNIACGKRYHPAWINIDFSADSNHVKKINILEGLPFVNNSIDFIYCSHFLEHLTKQQAIFLLHEVRRVLGGDGLCRFVVPDLENICREYLKLLTEVQRDETLAEKYNWITVELLDQMVRVNSGGMMQEIFVETSTLNKVNLGSYILQRTGDDLFSNVSDVKKRNINFSKIKNFILYKYLRLIRYLVPKHVRDLVFTNTSIGEKHQWMYDEYSLRKVFEVCGFKNIEIKKFNTSEIPNFNDYLLDITKDGTPYKGVSSLYIEARI